MGIIATVKRLMSTPLGSSTKKQATQNPDTRKSGVGQPGSRFSATGEVTGPQEAAGKGGKFAVYGLILLLVSGCLCGFLAFFRPAAAPVVAESSGVQATDQEAGAYAAQALAAWFSATGSNHQQMDSYFAGSNQSVTATKPTEYTNLAVASVEETGAGITTVKLSASIKTTSKSKTSKDEEVTYTPYWYQIPVKTQAGKMRAVTYPAAIPAPTTGDSVSLDYQKSVTDPALVTTVTDFLNAYAAGSGDVTRYTSPDSTVTAISPAYFTKTTVKSINSADDIKSSTPSTGQKASLLVDAELTRDTASKPAQYVLHVTARDGRWEISSIDSAPALTK